MLDPIELEYERDAQLDPSITMPEDPGVGTEKMRRALLTGSTGFLGAFLLKELLQQTDAEVHCLVRCSSPEHGMARIRQNLAQYDIELGDAAERVVPVVGDLTQPRLGLSAEAFDQLARDRRDFPQRRRAELCLYLRGTS